MTEERMHELFREMRDEPVPPESLARVRLAVSERSQSRNYWKPFAAILVPALIILIAALLHKPVKVQKPAEPAPVVANDQQAPLVIPASTQPPRRVIRRHRQHSEIANTQTVIRIETPDPDVVILLVGG